MLPRFKSPIPVLLLPLCLLAACATTPPSAEDAVAKRAQARFDALVSKDFRTAYGYFSPAFRERFTYEQYIQARPPRATFVSGRVVKVECASEAACDVEMETAYVSPKGVKAAPQGEVTRVTPERWVKVDGQWWLFQNR